MGFHMRRLFCHYLFFISSSLDASVRLSFVIAQFTYILVVLKRIENVQIHTDQ